MHRVRSAFLANVQDQLEVALIAAIGAARSALLDVLRRADFSPRSTPAAEPTPNLIGQTDRPLRYTPDNGDFVIENGSVVLQSTAVWTEHGFRVDAGDKPEFTLYLPGRGGTCGWGCDLSRRACGWPMLRA